MNLDELHDLYKRTHAGNPKRFLGYTTKLYVPHIKRLIELTGSEHLLDYGCGKGYQYLGERRVHERWGGILPHCWDPGVLGLSQRPERTFHGVICCDVLEHVPEELLGQVTADIFSFAERFVLMGIATVPSHKDTIDGVNSHLTVRDPAWWNKFFMAQPWAFRIRWEAWYCTYDKTPRPA